MMSLVQLTTLNNPVETVFGKLIFVVLKTYLLHTYGKLFLSSQFTKWHFFGCSLPHLTLKSSTF